MTMDYASLDNANADKGPVPCGSAMPSYDQITSGSHDPDGQVQPAENATNHSNTSNASVTASVKPRQLSKAEWEELKDLLYTYYIQENRTLSQVKDAMLKNGFCLTQKQLTNQFAKWKFKKNVKKSETERYLLGSDVVSGQDGLSVGGVRVTAAKRERWKKRARHTIRDEHGQRPSVNEEPKTRNAEDLVGHGTTLMNEETIVGPIPSHNPCETPSSLLAPSIPSRTPTASLSSTLSPNTQESPVFDSPEDHEANTVDDPSLAWLALPKAESQDQELMKRLFSALSITPNPNDMGFPQRSFNIQAAKEHSDSTSNEDFVTFNHGSGEHGSWQVTRVSMPKGSQERAASSAFKYPVIDAFIPSGEVVFTNPLRFELYPFPRLDDDHLAARKPSKYHDILRMEVEECSERIRMLQSPSGKITDPLMALMDRLAVAYFGLGHYDKAEQEFKRFLPTLLQRYAHTSRQVVSVKRDLTEVVLHLGRYEEANQLAQEVHTSALTIDIPCGSLIQRSLHVLAQSYGNLRNLQKEEDLLRQLVQIRLSSSGPRHGDTLAAIRSLCDSLIDAQRYAEGEELLRVATELGQGSVVSDRRKCLICRKLATVLYKQGSYRESEALYQKTIDMSVELLGKEHPDTLRCQFWLCKVLRAQGLLEDSYALHVRTVQQQIRTRGESRGSTIESMSALSNLLVQMGKIEDAEMWMKRALRCSQHIGGIDNTRETKFWADVAAIEPDEQQGRHQRIANLYEEMGNEISSLVGPGSRSIEEMDAGKDQARRWIP